MVYTPTATYRLQLSPDFTLEQLQPIISYLHKLGISTVYAAPLFAAREGSTHGYDVTNPTMLNPAIGKQEQLQQIAEALKDHKMGWLQDIVPNHMAYSPENSWLMDVLEKGPHSPYYPYFDFWNELSEQPDQEQIMTPFLGSKLEECLRKNELKVSCRDGRCFIQYYDNLYPLSLPAYTPLLQSAQDDQLKEALAHAEALRFSYNQQQDEALKQQLKEADKALQQCCTDYGKDPLRLKNLLDTQYYRLCYWKETEERINYRRFFTVNDLICLNIQNPLVFEGYHRYIKELIDKGIVQGLRVDHIDGLYDPGRYLEELRLLAGPESYLLVEKILEGEEKLEQQWPVQGTTGYDFLASLNALFAFPGAEKEISRIYEEISDANTSWDELVWSNKKLILHERMLGEFSNLLKLYYKAIDVQQHEPLPEAMAEALSCLLLSFTVYRTYINQYPIGHHDKVVLEEAFEKAEKKISEQGKAALQQLKEFLNTEGEAAQTEAKLQFILRMQQISGPLQAKGLEDTTFYQYNRLLSLNEVGNQPQQIGMDPDHFHQLMKRRQELMPLSLNCTATHDTKRGEDARQRLNVLSEITGRWEKTLRGWLQMNADKKQNVDGKAAPERNDEYFIYQSLLAFYPAQGQHQSDFVDRLQAYVQKAFREAKRNSNWSSPNAPYEEATSGFIDQLLKDDMFLRSFHPLVKDLAKMGMFKSMSQLLIKTLAPGIPDTYQGTELPDLSMVDPDNRREVNFRQREEWLDQLLEAELRGPQQLQRDLFAHITDGRLKLYLTHKFLVFRRQYPDLMNKGAYIPLQVHGKHYDKLLAFARLYNQEACMVIAPLYPALITEEPTYFPTEADWDNTYIVIPPDLTFNWIDIVTTQEFSINEKRQMPVAPFLRQLPVALLKGGKI